MATKLATKRLLGSDTVVNVDPTNIKKHCNHDDLYIQDTVKKAIEIINIRASRVSTVYTNSNRDIVSLHYEKYRDIVYYQKIIEVYKNHPNYRDIILGFLLYDRESDIGFHYLYKMIDKHLITTDRDIVLAIIKWGQDYYDDEGVDWENFCDDIWLNLIPELKEDIEIITNTLDICGNLFLHLNEKDRDNKEYLLSSLYLMFKFDKMFPLISKRLLNDKDVIRSIFEQIYTRFQFEFVEILNNNIKYIGDDIRKDEKFIKEMIDKYGLMMVILMSDELIKCYKY